MYSEVSVTHYYWSGPPNDTMVALHLVTIYVFNHWKGSNMISVFHSHVPSFLVGIIVFMVISRYMSFSPLCIL